MVNIIRNKKGSSYIQTVIIILIIAMIFSSVLTYASLMTLVSTAKENTQRVLDSYVIDNSIRIYESIKNGNDDMIYNDFNDEVKELIAKELNLEKSSSAMYSETSEREIIYYYSNPLTTNLTDDILELKINFKLIIPVKFAGQKLFDLNIPLEVKSLYVLKY